ncbi:MAG: DUF3568 family protein [Opitutales bacterium]|nr:DUF3568 family protein [Opitutales bacterium]
MKKSAVRPIFFTIALALAVPTAFSGCVVLAAAAAAGGTVAYVQGSLNSTLPSPIEDVQKAVKRALRNDLKFSLISAKEDAVSAEYNARTARDEKIVVILEKVSDGVTKISIRVGYFGDESLSNQILDSIKTRVS